MNLYCFVGNRSVNAYDVLGLIDFDLPDPDANDGGGRIPGRGVVTALNEALRGGQTPRPRQPPRKAIYKPQYNSRFTRIPTAPVIQSAHPEGERNIGSEICVHLCPSVVFEPLVSLRLRSLG